MSNCTQKCLLFLRETLKNLQNGKDFQFFVDCSIKSYNSGEMLDKLETFSLFKTRQLPLTQGGGKLPPPAGAHDFFAYFSINLTNHALIFCAFGRKMQIVENFEKILKNLLQKIAKNALF